MQNPMDRPVPGSSPGQAIPAKAGIQSATVSGSRVKPGMTVGMASIGFNLTLYYAALRLFNSSRLTLRIVVSMSAW